MRLTRINSHFHSSVPRLVAQEYSPLFRHNFLLLLLSQTRARVRLPINTAAGSQPHRNTTRRNAKCSSTRRMKEACSRGRHHHRRRDRRVAAAVPVPVSERSQVHIRRGGRKRRAFAGERSLSGECCKAVPRVLLSLACAFVCSPHVKCSRSYAAWCARPKFANKSRYFLGKIALFKFVLLSTCFDNRAFSQRLSLSNLFQCDFDR